MTRGEWIQKLIEATDDGVYQAVFRITRGCDRCAYYLPLKDDGMYECSYQAMEKVCYREQEEWLKGEMDV